jgi:6-phosphogluconolactonase
MHNVKHETPGKEIRFPIPSKNLSHRQVIGGFSTITPGLALTPVLEGRSHHVQVQAGRSANFDLPPSAEGSANLVGSDCATTGEPFVTMIFSTLLRTALESKTLQSIEKMLSKPIALGRTLLLEAGPNLLLGAFLAGGFQNPGFRISGNWLKSCIGSTLVLAAALLSGTVPLSAQLVYVANQFSHDISGYKIEDVTGLLTPVPGSPFANQVIDTSVALSPGRRFVYVANSGSNSVSGYEIDADTGALTPIPGSPFAAGNFPNDVAVPDTGRFAYVVNRDSNSISGYRIDADTGALTNIPGSPFATNGSPLRIRLDRTGRFAYVFISNSISGYEIDANTGALIPIPGSPFAAGNDPNDIRFDPTGRFAYVPQFSSPGNILGFRIDGQTGALTPIFGSPFAAGNDPSTIAFDPTGRFAYVPEFFSGDILGYKINGDTGALTPIFGSPFAAVGGSSFSAAVAVDPTGRFAYVGNISPGNLTGYRINKDTGALTPLSGSPLTTSGGPVSIAIAP